jgi:hypothetical protein
MSAWTLHEQTLDAFYRNLYASRPNAPNTAYPTFPSYSISMSAKPKPAFKGVVSKVKVPAKPVVPDPVQVSSDEEDSGEDVGSQASQPMDEDSRFPEITQKKGKGAVATSGRTPIIFERVATDAPFQLNGLLCFKNFDSLSFAVSKEDARQLNTALVEEFNCDPDKPLVKWSDDFGTFLLRGKPQGQLKIGYDQIEAKRGYTVKFNIGKWANPADGTSGISASILDLLDAKGASAVKLDIKFPKGSTFSAGRMLTKEEVAEMKRNTSNA